MGPSRQNGGQDGPQVAVPPRGRERAAVWPSGKAGAMAIEALAPRIANFAARLTGALERRGLSLAAFFWHLDRDGDAALSRAEMEPLLRGFAHGESDIVLNAMFGYFDKDRDNRVSLGDFCEGLGMAARPATAAAGTTRRLGSLVKATGGPCGGASPPGRCLGRWEPPAVGGRGPRAAQALAPCRARPGRLAAGCSGGAGGSGGRGGVGGAPAAPPAVATVGDKTLPKALLAFVDRHSADGVQRRAPSSPAAASRSSQSSRRSGSSHASRGSGKAGGSRGGSRGGSHGGRRGGSRGGSGSDGYSGDEFDAMSAATE